VVKTGPQFTKIHQTAQKYTRLVKIALNPKNPPKIGLKEVKTGPKTKNVKERLPGR
jgi:hypothetical protein